MHVLFTCLGIIGDEEGLQYVALSGPGQSAAERRIDQLRPDCVWLWVPSM